MFVHLYKTILLLWVCELGNSFRDSWQVVIWVSKRLKEFVLFLIPGWFYISGHRWSIEPSCSPSSSNEGIITFWIMIMVQLYTFRVAATWKVLKCYVVFSYTTLDLSFPQESFISFYNQFSTTFQHFRNVVAFLFLQTIR